SPLAAAIAADSSIADGVVGFSFGRAYAVSTCAGSDAPGEPGGGGFVRQFESRLSRRAEPGICGVPTTAGGAFARRGARTVWAFFRRALSIELWIESRDGGERDYRAGIGGIDSRSTQKSQRGVGTA